MISIRTKLDPDLVNEIRDLWDTVLGMKTAQPLYATCTNLVNDLAQICEGGGMRGVDSPFLPSQREELTSRLRAQLERARRGKLNLSQVVQLIEDDCVLMGFLIRRELAA